MAPGFGMPRAALCATLFALNCGCQNTAAPGAMTTRVPNGTWGSGEAVLTVHESGASFDAGCSHGTIEQSILVDASGHFDAGGTLVQERGGPAVGNNHPARYVGSTDGQNMSLSVLLTDTQQTVGPFLLVLGRIPSLAGCALV